MPSDKPPRSPNRSPSRPPSAPSLGFAIGASPHHVKGNVYNGTKQFFANSVDGGLDSLYRAIDDPALRDFIQQKFVPVAWYDVYPAIPLIRAEARALGLTTRRYLQLRTGFQAKQDLAGVYRVVLKLASIEMVALKLPRLFTQVFDFGSCDARVVAPGHVEGFVLDFPPPLYDWFAAAIEEYARQALTLAGARELAVTSRRVKAVTSPGEDAMASLQLEVHWKV